MKYRFKIKYIPVSLAIVIRPMPENFTVKPLGAVLQQADLVSAAQIEIALREQTQDENRRLGEILALHGWLKQETADFFAEQWPTLVSQKLKQPLGQYLKEAALLDEEQISAILDQQRQTGLLFGTLTALKGWLKQTTINFFLEYLAAEQQSNLEQNYAPFWLKLEEKASSPETVLKEVFSWTGDQPFLTQTLCQLLCDSESFIAEGKEAARVEQLVRTRLIDNWETQAAAEHFKAIRASLLTNQQCDPFRLLRRYRQILQQGEAGTNYTPEEVELLNSGLVVAQEDELRVSNRIYQSVFNQSWVERELAKVMQPSISETADVAQNKPILAVDTGSIPKRQRHSSANPTGQISRSLQRGPVHWDVPVNIFRRRNLGDIILIGLVVLLAIAGALSVVFNIFLKRLEGKIFQQGNELFNKGIYSEAIAKYDELLKNDGNYYQAWTNRGYALAGLGKYDRMLESCFSATIVEPEATYAWNCQGEALYNLKQYEEALAAFDKAIALNPTDPVFWINRGESLLALKRTSEALAATNEAIALLEQIKQVDGSEKIKRECSIALSNKGRALWEKRRYEAALAAYDQALGYVPDYFPAQRGRGMALKSLGRSEEALAEFERILNRTELTNAQKAQTRFYQGLTLCQVGQSQEALAAFEEALKLKPDYEAAEKAIRHCRK